MITKIKLKNVELNKEIEIGIRKEKYVLGLVDFGQAPASFNTTDYIQLIGSFVNTTRIDTRSITIKGAIFPVGAGMAEKKQELNRLINPKHKLIVTTDKYKIEIRATSSVIYSTERTKNNDVMCEFLIKGTAFEPTFKRIYEEVFYYSNAIKRPLFPMVIPKNKGICFGIKAAVNTQNLINDGDIETGFVCKITAQYGEVVNPKITDNKTGKYIEIILNMLKGDAIEISTVAGNKYVKFIRGSSEKDIFKAVTKKSSMSMTLSAGQNNITIAAALNAANLSSSIKLTPLYLEVQE